MRYRLISITLLLYGILVLISCNTRGQNPTTEQMMARADSIDSVMNLREQAVRDEENQRLKDSAEMMAAYLEAVENAREDSARIASAR